MRQETIHQPAEGAAGPVPVPGGGDGGGAPRAAAAAPLELWARTLEHGRRFSDEWLRARLGVPLRGGIRVSHENKCIVIVDRMDDASSHTTIGILARYMGEDRGGDGGADQALEGGNLDLALSRLRGYMVLGFARDGDDLVFDGPVECDSFRFERHGGRNVLTFGMRAAGGRGDDDYEKPSPEVEKTLQSIESGTFAGKRYTIDEYIEYIKKVMG